MVATRNRDECVEALPRLQSVQEVLHQDGQGPRRCSVIVLDEQVDLILASPLTYPFALLWETGTAAHIDLLADHARSQGVILTESGMTSAGAGIAAATEDEIYDALGLQTIPPEIRDGTDEVQLARERGLPAMVDIHMIRGDLHMHTRWSDGRDDIETMALAARALGYEYIAITDHSPSSGAARSLTERTLGAQMQAIKKARAAITGIEILHGAEVDILPDGRLDFPDALLEQLDLVLASLHDRAGHTSETLTDRYVTAMQHPLVNIITHPTNRLVGRRDGYDMDFDRLFHAAARTGTLLEIDGAPIHLDMDGSVARQAVAGGVTVAINSDCHRAEWLARQMGFGIATARRGRVESPHVLNTRSLSSVRETFLVKRGR